MRRDVPESNLHATPPPPSDVQELAAAPFFDGVFVSSLEKSLCFGEIPDPLGKTRSTTAGHPDQVNKTAAVTGQRRISEICPSSCTSRNVASMSDLCVRENWPGPAGGSRVPECHVWCNGQRQYHGSAWRGFQQSWFSKLDGQRASEISIAMEMPPTRGHRPTETLGHQEHLTNEQVRSCLSISMRVLLCDRLVIDVLRSAPGHVSCSHITD